ncbi:WD repeat-containing protein 97 [Rhineura floridana]|uniref:WD repeat-containing protein 97 n=1 Tax=Rhineura floridana TaxID=261503 RepID=UPI002AC8035A|nr:WD repeat-containing protein 97 [Rhineura floridana]
MESAFRSTAGLAGTVAMQSSPSGRRKRLHCQSQPAKKKIKEDEEVEKQKQNEAAEAPQSRQQSKGRTLWRKLQAGFRHALERMKNEEMKVTYLSHGLQHLCRIALVSPVRYVTHDSHKRIFVVLDSENMLHFVREDGSYKSGKRAPAPMTGLLYATQVNQFVAWDDGGLQVLDSGFQLLSQVQSTLPIRCGLYSEYLNRIVTAGDGNFTIWDFRYGFRSLQCRVIVTEGLGPGDVFSHLALDASSTDPHRCFASCDTGAAAFDVSKGKLMSFKKELHSRVITDITYCEAIGCAITASRDTTIKVWDKNWHIQTVFVGHTAPVIAVTIYPQRPLIFSASQDGTIRTWNLDTIDQVDQVHISEPIEVLETKTTSRVISVSGASLNLWKINKLYSLYTSVGSPIKRLSCINLMALGNFPVRILCVCQDSTVRMVDAQSGIILSVLFLDNPLQALDMAYCLPRETLFVLVEDGTLLRANSALDPMPVKKSMPSSSWESSPCSLLVYSHMVDPERAYSEWLEVVDSKGYRMHWQKVPQKMQEKNRYMLILGHKTGFLTIMEWSLSRTQYKVEAHGSAPVTALAEYPTQTCIISAGADLTVKMWRIFPYTMECLVPLMCFSCASPALHMCSLGETLAVAFQDPETVTYSITYYNLMEQTRCEHGPEDDAQDGIAGLCCCPNLKLFASASRDGSVKVWDINNKLLRHLKLNTIPESLAFANDWGDLLVGIERHLYLIHHNKYLPSYYKMKLMCAKFLEPIKDVPLPLSDSCFEALVKENARRLMQDPPLEETESPVAGSRRLAMKESKMLWEMQAKTQGFSQMAKRNQDLELVQKGKKSTTKKLRLTREMKEEAFEKYLQIFYKKQPKIEIPEEDTFNADEVLEVLCRADSVSELYGPDGMFLGCFRQPSVLKAANQMLEGASSLAHGSGQISSTLPSRIREALFLLPPMRKVTSAQMGVRGKAEQPSEEVQELLLPLPSPSLGASQHIFGPGPEEAAKSQSSLRATSRGLLLSAVDSREGRIKARKEQFDKDLDMIKESETVLQVLPSSQVSLSPSSTVDHTKSEKSVVFKESPSPDKSQDSPRSLSSPSRMRSPTSSVTIKGFFPERPPTSSQDHLKLQTVTRLSSGSNSAVFPGLFSVCAGSQEQESQPGLLLPRISSGFIPNSVAALQFYSQKLLMEDREETFVRVIGPEEVPESSSGSRILAEWKVVMGEDEQPSPERGVSAAGSLAKSRSKKSMPEVFMTQLDESQYRDLEAEPPSFIVPFMDMAWFMALFPEGFPPGMSLNQFLTKLLASLVSADFGTKVDLVEAIVSLKEKMGNRMKDAFHDTLIQVLNKKSDTPSFQERKQRKFIWSALRALMTIRKDSKELMVELMTYYLKSPVPARMMVKDLMKEVGVQDPHNYFYKELDCWQVEETDSKEAMRGTCDQWLEGLMQELQEHRGHILGQKDPSGRKRFFQHFQKEQSSSTVDYEGHPESKYSFPESYKEVQGGVDQEGQPERKYSLESNKEGQAEEDLDNKEQAARRKSLEEEDGDQEEESPQEQVDGDKMDQEEQPERRDPRDVEAKAAQCWMQAVLPIDAIHYFTEKVLARELEEMKWLVSSALDSPRDTVMALPPIKKKRAILRLGETNTMLRKRIAERFYFPYIFPRYLMKGFVPFMKLPLPKINLDPFPPTLERPASPKSFTAMQQLVRKYFIPKFSYADSYP